MSHIENLFSMLGKPVKLPIKKSPISAVAVTSWLFCFMATITSLSYQKRQKDRVNVFLDGEFAFGLAESVAMRLKVGQQLSFAEIEALQKDDDVQKAKKIAVNLIARRPRSIFEIKRHLAKKGYDEPTRELVAEQLEGVDLLNDVSFANYWVEQREAFRPRSKRALRQELMQKGVDRDIIDAAVANIEEESSAHRLAQKRADRWAYLVEDEFKGKLSQYLQRQGFPYDIVRMTTNEIWQSLEREEDIDDDFAINEGDGK